jgi:hypothetical protein
MEIPNLFTANAMLSTGSVPIVCQSDQFPLYKEAMFPTIPPCEWNGDTGTPGQTGGRPPAHPIGAAIDTRHLLRKPQKSAGPSKLRQTGALSSSSGPLSAGTSASSRHPFVYYHVTQGFDPGPACCSISANGTV